MRIANVSTHRGQICDCAVDAIEGENTIIGTAARFTQCRLQAYDRRQAVWTIVEAACAAIRSAERDELETSCG